MPPRSLVIPSQLCLNRPMRRTPARLTVLPLLFLVPLLSGNGWDERHAETYTRYAVATAHPLGSRAGAEILEKGGNAADAAIAARLALGVVNPIFSGLGGGGFALYYNAKTRRVRFFDFRERAPQASTPDMFAEQEDQDGPFTRPSLYGGLATAVPGEPAGLEMLHKKFGKLPLKRIAQPAIRFAEEGHRLEDFQVPLAHRLAAQLVRDPVLAERFKPGTLDVKVGAIHKQPKLAKTLRAFAEQGAKPFYEGWVAQEIVRSVGHHGGIITMADLRDYKPVEREPLVEKNLLGHRWYTAPPPSAGGYTLIAGMKFMERVISPNLRKEGGPWLLHTFAESAKGPFMDRAAHFGDPDFVSVPVRELLSDQRIIKRSMIFRPSLALPAKYYHLEDKTKQAMAKDKTHGTSHLCVVDRHGNVAAITSTVNFYFGARYTAAGMVMNDEMDDFSEPALEDGEQPVNAFGLPTAENNLPAPGKRPVSTMSPTIVFKNRQPVLCIGAAGGSRIVTAVQQVAWHTLVRGLAARDAVRHPRVHHQGTPDVLRVEQDSPLTRVDEMSLEARGYDLEAVPYSAVVQAIHIEGKGRHRKLHAISDPRKIGQPAGK